jgi:hypothetical protein
MNTMDRVDFTLRTLAGIDTESGFDLVWSDGSRTAAGRDLVKSYQTRNVPIVERNLDIGGGAAKANHYALKRVVELGYDYCGMIENDVVLEPGWFGKLMGTLEEAAQEGVAVGAATVRTYESRVLEYRRGYALMWNAGWGMILFPRSVAQLVVDQYYSFWAPNADNFLSYRKAPGSRLVSAKSIRRFYAEVFGLDLAGAWELFGGLPDRPLEVDWAFAPFLYRRGYASVGSIPNLALDLEYDVEFFLKTKYVGTDKSSMGLVWPSVRLGSLWWMRLSDPFFEACWSLLRASPNLYRTILALYRRWRPRRPRKPEAWSAASHRLAPSSPR